MLYPKRPFRGVEQELRNLRNSIHGMLHHRLHIFLCEISIVLHIEDGNYETCFQFASFFLQIIQTDEFFVNRIIYAHNCVVQVDGKVNKQT